MNVRPRIHTMDARGRDVLLQCLQHDMHSQAVRSKALSEKTAPFVVSGATVSLARVAMHRRAQQPAGPHREDDGCARWY